MMFLLFKHYTLITLVKVSTVKFQSIIKFIEVEVHWNGTDWRLSNLQLSNLWPLQLQIPGLGRHEWTTVWSSAALIHQPEDLTWQQIEFHQKPSKERTFNHVKGHDRQVQKEPIDHSLLHTICNNKRTRQEAEVKCQNEQSLLVT